MNQGNNVPSIYNSNKFVIFNYVLTTLTIIIQYKRLETGAAREP
jgi:hypothetical protein